MYITLLKVNYIYVHIFVKFIYLPSKIIIEILIISP